MMRTFLVYGGSQYEVDLEAGSFFADLNDLRSRVADGDEEPTMSIPLKSGGGLHIDVSPGVPIAILVEAKSGRTAGF